MSSAHCKDSAGFSLRLPREQTVSSACARYLLQVGKYNRVISVTSEKDASEPVLVDLSKEKPVASRLVEIVSWLGRASLPQTQEVQSPQNGDLLQSEEVSRLCGGEEVLDRRKVTRAVKRVLSWEKDWSNHKTPPMEQMSHALSKQIIFDKMVRRKNMKYIVDNSTQDKLSGRGVFLSAADIVLCVILYSWLLAFTAHQDYLVRTIPSVIGYVRNILIELMELNEKLDIINSFTFSLDGFVESERNLHNCWVMNVTLSHQNSKPFRFKDLKLPSSSPTVHITSPLEDGASVEETAGACRDCSTSLESDENFEAAVDGLINFVNWSGNGACMINSENVSHYPTQQSNNQLSSLLSSSDKRDHLYENSISSTINELIFQMDEELFWETMALPPKRKSRKKDQIISLLRYASRLLPQGGTAVEFCCGGGYVGIALAALRPDATILLTDMNSISLAFAKERIQKLALRNVEVLRCELSHWESASSQFSHDNEGVDRVCIPGGRFHLGLALHACGTATDTVGLICAKAQANFVLSPCCYGFIKHAAIICHECNGTDTRFNNTVTGNCGADESDVSVNYEKTVSDKPFTGASASSICETKLSYPLSDQFHKAGWKASWYPLLCRTADHTFWSHDSRATTFNSAGQRAMRLIDTDRLLHFTEIGYTVSAHYMEPRDASPKNHILTGYLVK